MESKLPAGNAIAILRHHKKVPETIISKIEMTEEEKEHCRKKNTVLREKQRQAMAKIVAKRKDMEKNELELKVRLEKRNLTARLQSQQHLKVAEAKSHDASIAKIELEAKQAAEMPEEVKNVVNISAMVSRLTKTSEKDAESVPEARDFATWKKRHGLDSTIKVFSVTGWYPAMKTALEKRGWYHNDDRESPYFDLKWTLKSDNLKGLNLEPSQVRKTLIS